MNRGQHMLISSEIEELKIIDKNISESDKIIEIGGGEGSITERVARKNKNFDCFEIDEKFKDKLDLINKKYPDINFIFDDALKYSWRRYNKLVSNIPFHLAESIFYKCIKDNVAECILIISERTFENIKNESKMGIITRSYYNILESEDVHRKLFLPVPDTNCKIVHLKRKEKNKTEKEILKVVFYNGKIKNSLEKIFIERGMTKRKASEKINSIGFNKLVLEKDCSRITTKVLIKLRKRLEEDY